MEEEKNYEVDKRKFAVRFLFKDKFAARDFRLPKEFQHRFELNRNIDHDNHEYIRIAQIKLNSK